MKGATGTTTLASAAARTWARRARSSPELVVLDRAAQPLERDLPVGGDAIDRAPRFVERPGLELPDALAPALPAADEPRLGEHAQVLGDRLAGDARALGQAGDGGRAALREAGHEGQARLVAERGEDRGRAAEGDRRPP